MSTTETPEQTVARIVTEARAVASDLPFDQRAFLIREVVNSVRNAVKFDPTFGGAPEGAEWELDGLAEIGDAAETYYYAALAAKQSRQL